MSMTSTSGSVGDGGAYLRSIRSGPSVGHTPTSTGDAGGPSASRAVRRAGRRRGAKRTPASPRGLRSRRASTSASRGAARRAAAPTSDGAGARRPGRGRGRCGRAGRPSSRRGTGSRAGGSRRAGRSRPSVRPSSSSSSRRSVGLVVLVGLLAPARRRPDRDRAGTRSAPAGPGRRGRARSARTAVRIRSPSVGSRRLHVVGRVGEVVVEAWYIS